MLRSRIEGVSDPAALGQRWAALERHAPANFFRSWMFLGCLAEQRFAGARLLSVTQDGHDVALALLGGRAGHLWLNQTGNIAHDQVFIEHNGLLAAPEATLGIPGALRLAAARGRLELSGIDDQTLLAARSAGWLRTSITRRAPVIALDALDRPFLETLSANARAQIRRSQRLYGPDLQLRAAANLDQALAWFAEMVAVHQASWTARGQPGAFAHPHMVAFHRALIARAFAQGQAHLLRIDAGDRHIGTLYSLITDGRVLCYQSGLSPIADNREKPGLCCHALAIAHYASQGYRLYDLLADADRYKTTLAAASQTLHWATLCRPWSSAGLRGKIKELVRR